MSNVVFPSLPGLAWSVLKAPQFKTQIQKSVSGAELRAAFMSYPIYTITLTYEVLRSATAYGELQNLLGFFNARQGSYDSFLYIDPEDNTVAAQNFGTGDGSTKSFQLLRSYGGFLEPVMNLNGTPTIKVNGVIKSTPTDYSISSTGVVTFVTAPGNTLPLTWDGSFYYRVRFENDSTEFENFMYKLWSLKKLVLYGTTGNKV